MNFLQINFIGRPAQESLAKAAEIRTLGNTSRGLFLELPSGRIVFISREPYRGPLTLNLSGEADNLSLVKTAEEGNIAGDTLSFPNTGISISWQHAEVWHPAPLPARIEADLSTISTVLTPLQDKLLDEILVPAGSNRLSALERRILDICGQGRFGDWETALDDSRALLGLGTGLTPEGDDFLIGLSLAFVRAKAGEEQIGYAQEIVRLAKSHTTGLSANLLACAASGLADERLIDACDALAANAPQAAAAVQTLLSWGSTSGRMALAGIIAGLLLR